MPRRPHTPPEDLPNRSFSTTEARSPGLTAHHLEGPGYRQLTRGVWIPAHLQTPADPTERVRTQLHGLLEAKHDCAASHLTAAQLLGLRLPDALRRDTRLHITRHNGYRPPGGHNVHGHCAELPPEDLVSMGGILSTGPARTAIDLAAMRELRWFRISDDDLVALLDGIICEHANGPLAGSEPMRSLPGLSADLDRMKGKRGVRRVRLALQRCAVGADSMLETRARLLLAHYDHTTPWITDHQLQAPGHRTVWPDLADIEHRLSLQLDGPHHDSPEQRLRDIDRLRATEAAGWTEIRVSFRDLQPIGAQLPALIHLVRQARRRRQ